MTRRADRQTKDKAKVKDLLAAVRTYCLQAAEGSTKLLSQIDRAPPFLLERFASDLVDWDPAYSPNDYIFLIEAWNIVLDAILGLEAGGISRELLAFWMEQSRQIRNERKRSRAKAHKNSLRLISGNDNN
jgi:hypothetical protein